MKNQQAVLVFTELVDSVKSQKAAGAAVYGRLKARHDALVKSAVAACPGAAVIESTRDGFQLRFPTCRAAVEACLRFQYGLAADDSENIRLRARVGVHCGEVFCVEGVTSQFMGMAPNVTSRVMSLALPGQVLVTEPVYHDAHQSVREHPRVAVAATLPALRWINHGQYFFKGETLPIFIFEVGGVGIAPLQTPPGHEKARRAEDVQREAEAEAERLRANPRSRWRLALYGIAAVVLMAALGGAAFWMVSGRNAAVTPHDDGAPVAVPAPPAPPKAEASH